MRTVRNNTKGAALVEAALALPLIALLIAGIIQYSLILAAHITIRSASAAAARAATLDYGQTDQNSPLSDTALANVLQVAEEALRPMLDAANATIAVTDIPVNGVTARKVEITYNYPLILGNVVPNASGGALQITSTSVMR
jgi:Flp pilus assembly protein TadG